MSAEHHPAVTAYLAERARIAGSVSTWKKACAARRNGKKPCAKGKTRGRPRKTVANPKPTE